MYKNASRKLQRTYVVDRINQSGVYIGLETEGDPLLAPEFMSDRQLADERAQLVNEKLRWEADLAAAKASGDERRVKGIGQTLQVLCCRLSLIKPEIKKRNIANDDKIQRELRKLLRVHVGDEVFATIVAQAERNVTDAANEA